METEKGIRRRCISRVEDKKLCFYWLGLNGIEWRTI